MSNTNLPLTTSFRKTIEKFKNHNSVGLIGTEHVIFVPASQLHADGGNSADSPAFMMMLGTINRKKEWNCPVEIGRTRIGAIEGLEIVIKFSKETDYHKIGEYLDVFINENS
ncbi:hypothetical protein [Bacillus phage phiAGATE]|uniref:Uncharacterized protein n=1 Tax=Bacillus phage phiAGATE TaxID=1204533 RepID=L0LBV3_9CAUD|nr:hypothetical protein G380_gp193 [Bacillus phage phiAGATE]AGB62630.1 hypothetical protein [Bacillus phage phiAGATE]